jgi:hypothetical protein
MKAVEVVGDIHKPEVMDRLDPGSGRERLMLDAGRLQAMMDRGWEVKLVMQDELRPSRLGRTKAQLARFLEPGPAAERPGIRALFAPDPDQEPERARTRELYAAASRLESLIEAAGGPPGGYRDHRATREWRGDLVWPQHKAAIKLYADEDREAADLRAREALAARGWRVLPVVPARDLTHASERPTAESAAALARGDPPAGANMVPYQHHDDARP